MSSPPRKLLSIRDAALATGLTPKALRRRIERGTIASVLENDRRWISMDELLRQGLLVPLDGERPARRPSGRRGTGTGTVGTRLQALEERLAAQQAELEDLRGRVDRLERASGGHGGGDGDSGRRGVGA